ncbi:zinc finger protein 26-like [Phlebotomus argentipes]|uniref:zinc finger protein 26-like n=1 Tax=Phlebotomus argentipes TaxID=94469 RepID=UPI002892C908|nr:zinc finger protein 26-like [Phlebotomus argentipes]
MTIDNEFFLLKKLKVCRFFRESLVKNEAIEGFATLGVPEVTKKEIFHCPFCEKTCVAKCGFTRHLQTHNDSRVCEICEKDFKTRTGLKRHMAQVHSTERNFECAFCSKKFKIKNSLLEHVRSHITMPEQCPICGKVFRNPWRLRDHQKKRHGKLANAKLVSKYLISHVKLEKPQEVFDCDICSKTYKRRNRLTQHRKTHFSLVEPLKCLYCISSFNKRPNYARHIDYAHRGLPLDEGAEPSCTVCKAKFANFDELKMHVTIHKREKRQRKRYECAICNYTFSKKDYLEAHVERIHLKLRGPTKDCLICSKRVSVGAFRDHMKSHQTLEGNDRKCPYCPETFDRKNTLVFHVRISHRGLNLNITGPPFKCSVCKDLYETLDELKKHVEIHSRNRTCEICQKSFSTVENLLYHIGSFHRNSNLPMRIAEKRFECSTCGRKYRHRDRMEKHSVSCSK